VALLIAATDLMPVWGRICFLIALALAVYLAVRNRGRLRDAGKGAWIEARSGEPVKVEHAEDLRATGARLESSIANGGWANYGGAVAERDFKRHFGGLGELLDEWHDIVAKEKIRRQDATHWIGEVVPHSYSDPPLLVTGILHGLRTFLYNRLDDPTQNIGHVGSWHRMDSQLEGITILSWIPTIANGWPVAEGTAQELSTVEEQIVGLVRKFTASDAFLEAIAARDARILAQQELAACLQDVRTNTDIYGSCPDCRGQASGDIYRKGK
jgi:hypothetical protein